MRKIIGIGETVLDIIFDSKNQISAVPGGSVFNSMVSLGRLQLPVCFISETGNDKVGDIILSYMRSNNISTEYVNVFPTGKSPISLAFLDKKNDAEYIFYKDYPKQRLEVDYPEIQKDDIVMLGSYFALNPVLREKVLELLDKAREAEAIIYYDPNFRPSHKEEAIKLSASIIENLEYSTIVRGSQDDFMSMYGMSDPDKIYHQKIKFYSPIFICTTGGNGVHLYTPEFSKVYEVPSVSTISTVGAGDNFNAGLIYGIYKHGIRYCDLSYLKESQWDQLIAYAVRFASDVCQSINNSISPYLVDELLNLKK